MGIAFVMFCVLVSPPYSPLLRPWSLQAPAAADETITIDGSKNPELVPQWAAWRFAFTQIRLANDLPSDVLAAASKPEAESIAAAARRDDAFYKECEKRVTDLQAVVLAESDRARQVDLLRRLQPKVDDIEMQSRRHTLSLRDELLNKLRTEPRAALVTFVEAGKAGHRVTLPKSRLNAYLKPE
jgi:hypothetical protein